MNKRYQVFVSSTYHDLQVERMEVMAALLELDCIPCGMEYFPAADETQWSFIQRLIDCCDYYVVIVGGCYGSLAPDGFSYTQKEYEYAVSKGIPTLAFIHHDLQKLPKKFRESNMRKRKKLEQFVESVKGHLCKEWKNADHLAGAVTRSLNQLIKTKPRIGWVRATSVANRKKIPKKAEKFGNIYWVAHDLLWTVIALLNQGSREQVLEGLYQSMHHLSEAGLASTPIGSRVKSLYGEAQQSSVSDWTNERHAQVAREIQSMARELGGTIAAMQHGFKSHRTS